MKRKTHALTLVSPLDFGDRQSNRSYAILGIFDIVYDPVGRSDHRALRPPCSPPTGFSKSSTRSNRSKQPSTPNRS